ncbi:MAG: hypothetical protein IKH75_05935 [Ruminococcus sp.]|nr:hypothetical protein [Ruminococcus sp.]
MKYKKLASVFSAAAIAASMAGTTVYAQDSEIPEEKTTIVAADPPEGTDSISYEPQTGDMDL